MDSTPRPDRPPLAVGLVGYGRMGRTLHRLAAAAGAEVTCIVSPHAPEATHRRLDAVTPPEAPSVWIDFSHPDAAWPHLEAYARGTVPAVIGTTGWADRLPEATALFERATVPVVWAGNFSLGVTLFLRIVQQAAALVGQAGGYDAGIHEVHHRAKADSPSGTALHVAEAVRSGWPDAPADRAISSTRVGHVPGTHTVWFDGPEDTLELTHTARSRDGFATGALRAATWLGEQPPAPGLWRFDELVAHRLGEAPIPVSHRIDHHPTEEDA